MNRRAFLGFLAVAPLAKMIMPTRAAQMDISGLSAINANFGTWVTGITHEADRFEIVSANHGPKVRFEMLSGPDGDFIGLRVPPQSGGCAALTAYEEVQTEGQRWI